jgi:hypothetical protein
MPWANYIVGSSNRLILSKMNCVYGKTAKGFLDGLPLRCGCVEVCSSSGVERSCSFLAMVRTTFDEAFVRCQCVGPTIPDSMDAVTGDGADQASAAALTMHIWRDGCALPQRLPRFPAAWSSSLTQKPWRPGNAFTWNQSTSLSAG